MCLCCPSVVLSILSQISWFSQLNINWISEKLTLNVTSWTNKDIIKQVSEIYFDASPLVHLSLFCFCLYFVSLQVAHWQCSRKKLCIPKMYHKTAHFTASNLSWLLSLTMLTWKFMIAINLNLRISLCMSLQYIFSYIFQSSFYISFENFGQVVYTVNTVSLINRYRALFYHILALHLTKINKSFLQVKLIISYAISSRPYKIQSRYINCAHLFISFHYRHAAK